MYYNEDDRAQRLFDVFSVLDGQINVSYVNSTEHIVAWHRHFVQTAEVARPVPDSAAPSTGSSYDLLPTADSQRWRLPPPSYPGTFPTGRGARVPAPAAGCRGTRENTPPASHTRTPALGRRSYEPVDPRRPADR